MEVAEQGAQGRKPPDAEEYFEIFKLKFYAKFIRFSHNLLIYSIVCQYFEIFHKILLKNIGKAKNNEVIGDLK